MNIHLAATHAAEPPALGNCFRCPRRGVQTIRVGEISTPGGPGHTAAETPLFACRTCEQELIVIHQRAHEPPARRYVPARPH
ncbi:hypothetical protein [Streptomyces sp. NPDC093109]|uniref:hypothetical protein n=1 Tax=Streptomyces sp. NPDC093109 TaxID=3154977 RepID=UPI00344E1AB6